MTDNELCTTLNSVITDLELLKLLVKELEEKVERITTNEQR